jgi:predicted transcriptional regulator YdeE
LEKPLLVHREESKFVGPSVRTANRLEMQPDKGQIGLLWKRFFEEGMAEKISGRVHPDLLFGIYMEYESDVNGMYSFLVGCEVASTNKIPEGMRFAIAPPGKYLKFVGKGAMPNAVIEAWGSIWKYFSGFPEFERAYTTDYEIYNSPNPTEVEIYIAVK